jgi:phosphopantothenoylcysteine decarboxylase/phosphopantothenate--cysteine ligase
MIDACINELRAAKKHGEGYDALISSAAIADFTGESSDVKIPSGGELHLRLVPTQKLIEEVRKEFPELTIVGFKAETNVSEQELIRRAREKQQAYNLAMVVANDVGAGGIGTEDNEVFISRAGVEDIKHVKGAKKLIADAIVEDLASFL